ncbi:MAG: hypothetical protein MZU97_11005 [Bacillus subtilis]|nr:hypothetical protein [Bacillus subtilis]
MDLYNEFQYGKSEMPLSKNLMLDTGIMMASLMDSEDEDVKAGTANKFVDKVEDHFIVDKKPIEEKLRAWIFMTIKQKKYGMNLALGKDVTVTCNDDF